MKAMPLLALTSLSLLPLNSHAIPLRRSWPVSVSLSEPRLIAVSLRFELRQVLPWIDPALMTIAEHQLQAVALSVQFDDPHTRVNHWRRTPQAKRPALRARALAAQFGMVEQLLAAIRPVQPYPVFTLRIADRQRIHCS